MYSCLIVDEMHPSIEEMLKAIEVEPYYHPKISREDMIEELANHDILFIRSKTRVDAELLKNADKLKVIGRAGSGMDNLDIEYIEEQKIKVINAPEGNRDAVSEHTLGLILSLLNNIVSSDKEVRNRYWDREGNRGTELSSKTVGVIGYGYMGKAVVKRLKAFQCKILIYDKYIKDYEYGHQDKVTLEEIFEKCDVVTFHVPLTTETKGWIDEDFINQFKSKIYLINTSRGEIAQNAAIVKGIKKGKILGAALDVLENEKLDKLAGKELQNFENLAALKNVILTPHIGGWSIESYFKINKVLVDKLDEVLLGKT